MKKKKKRKNFFPTLIVIVLLLLALLFLIYFVDPKEVFALPLFFILLFLFLLFIFSTLFASTRRGLIISLVLTLFTLLRYLGVGHVLNFLLLAGLAISVEIYLSKD